MWLQLIEERAATSVDVKHYIMAVYVEGVWFQLVDGAVGNI